MARSYATDCREPCQDRDIAALSGFATCAIRKLRSSYLPAPRVGIGRQNGMHSFFKIKPRFKAEVYFFILLFLFLSLLCLCVFTFCGKTIKADTTATPIRRDIRRLYAIAGKTVRNFRFLTKTKRAECNRPII